MRVNHRYPRSRRRDLIIIIIKQEKSQDEMKRIRIEVVAKGGTA